jgi:hypothetical protein
MVALVILAVGRQYQSIAVCQQSTITMLRENLPGNDTGAALRITAPNGDHNVALYQAIQVEPWCKLYHFWKI